MFNVTGLGHREAQEFHAAGFPHTAMTEAFKRATQQHIAQHVSGQP